MTVPTIPSNVGHSPHAAQVFGWMDADGKFVAIAVDADGYMRTSAAPSNDFAGQMGGSVITPEVTFTRPANTTAYTSGDLVANNVTAGSVVPMEFTAARTAANSFSISRIRLRKSGTSVTNAAFRVHLYAAAPTPANGDNATWSTDKAADYIGSYDITMDKAFTDGAFGAVTGTMMHRLAAGDKIYALIEARGAYTPVSGETFGLRLEVVQD